MYLRWKKTRRRDRWGEENWAHSAVLVESVRMDGKPRQRMIAYVGTIQDRYLLGGADTARWRLWRFWDNADAALDRLALPDIERAKIVAALEAVVPMPQSSLGPSLADLEAHIAVGLKRRIRTQPTHE